MTPRHPVHEGTSWSERKRLMRFRRQREHLRFSEEIKLVPRGLVIGTLTLFASLILLAMFLCAQDLPQPWHMADDMGNKAAVGLVGLIGLSMAIPLAILIFLTGYVYRDARRRGMNAALWVFLVLVIMPAYLVVGFVLYFNAREPLPYHCPKCGFLVNARFHFCPGCKYELHRSCSACHREVGDVDRYCPHCGNDLVPGNALEPA
jgi:RNA polymerase subunit RPABC4/transcription elongation factor Spt4